MELRVLRYFLAVAREESITRAAKALHISQPTLSKQLMDLEQELGKTLFLRGKRNISLTEDGVFLQKHAQEIIELADKTIAQFKDTSQTITGDIFIGGGETDGMRLIARTVKKLASQHPEIRYHLYSGNAEDVTDRLDKGLLDFGILIEPVDLSKYDFIKLPLKDTWGLLMKKSCSLAQKPFIHPEDLKNLPLICSRQSLVRNELSGWLGKSFDSLQIVADYNLIYNAALMVEEGIGYALCLDKLVNTTGDSPLVFRPLNPPLTSGLLLVFKKYQVFSEAAKSFLKILQEEI